MKEEVFLILLYRDLRVQKLVKQPTVTFFDGSVEIILKDHVACDSCGAGVAVNEKELEDEEPPVGYILCDEEYIIEVVCEGCRRRYFKDLR